MASCPPPASPTSSSSPPTAASDANLTQHETSVVCLADEEDAVSKHCIDVLPSQSAVAACQPRIHARVSTVSYDRSESTIAETPSTPRRELNIDCSRNDNTSNSSSINSRSCNNNMNSASNNNNGGSGSSSNINSVNIAVADDCSNRREGVEVSSSTLPALSSVVVVDERTSTNRRTSATTLAASTTTTAVAATTAAAAPSPTTLTSTTVVAANEDNPVTTTMTTTIATSSIPPRRVSPIPSLDLRNHHEDTVSRRPPPQSDMSATPTTTPTAAIMRTPPSPRSTVILPLPRVTVTSPSDLCPSNLSSTVQIELPSPQTPPSPPLPPHPISVVIVPFPTTISTATQLSLSTMETQPLPMDTSALPPPPPYEGFIKDDDADGGDDSINGIRRTPDGYGLAHLDNLPSYAVATDLPTYEEAEIAKANEMRENRDRTHGTNGSQVPPTGQQQQQQQHMNYPEDERVPAYDPYHLTGVSLGTDWIFLCTFAISFLFNWLGFLISLCITNTVAGRCGALSGLGLSLVKWVVIMKHNTMAQGFMQGDSWVWWILMICGFLLFLRGCIQYVNMKYEWRRIFVRLQQMYFS